MKNIILVGGNGKWAQSYIKTLSSPNFPFKDINLIIADRNSWKSLIDSIPDYVIIATPPDSHIEIAAYALKNHIPTMIEKPLALSLENALQLKSFNSPILVNHINLFSKSYEDLCKFVNKNITNINTNGFNNGPFRSYSSLWDYGPHCLSMILYLIKKLPVSIHATKIASQLYNISMDFGDFKSNSMLGAGAQYRCRSMSVDFDGMSIYYNDINRPINHIPPLQNALEHFIGKNFEDKRFGLDLSFNILKLLEYCDQSLKTCCKIYL